jgi:sulfonate transport system permease protein
MSKSISAEALVKTKVSRGTPFGQRLLPWLFPIVLILIWQIASSTGLLASRILPAPSAVVTAFWHLLISGELWQHVKVSAGRALLGLLVGGGLGLLLGLLNGSSKLASTLLDTTLQMIRNIPALALIPLVILWFGIDESAKLFLVAIGVFFPIYTLYTTNFTEPLSYQDSAFLKLPKFP